jgi:hypothetical protein
MSVADTPENTEEPKVGAVVARQFIVDRFELL